MVGDDLADGIHGIAGYTGQRNAVNARHGHGRWQRPDGQRYVGEWRDDQRHGKGEMVRVPLVSAWEMVRVPLVSACVHGAVCGWLSRSFARVSGVLTRMQG